MVPSAGITQIRFEGRWRRPPSQPGVSSELPLRRAACDASLGDRRPATAPASAGSRRRSLIGVLVVGVAFGFGLVADLGRPRPRASEAIAPPRRRLGLGLAAALAARRWSVDGSEGLPLAARGRPGSICTITPRPSQCSHGSLNASRRPCPTRLRVIWTSPERGDLGDLVLGAVAGRGTRAGGAARGRGWTRAPCR